MNDLAVLKGEFDIETHKKHFINYLEVIIDSEGKVHYAVPSHQGILEKMVCKKNNAEYDEWDLSMVAGSFCPRDKMFDYSEWLCEETGCIMVWGIPVSYVIGKPNEKQKQTLEILKKEKLL